jgi:hypothetical protein
MIYDKVRRFKLHMFNGATIIISGLSYYDAITKHGINTSQVVFWKEL